MAIDGPKGVGVGLLITENPCNPLRESGCTRILGHDWDGREWRAKMLHTDAMTWDRVVRVAGTTVGAVSLGGAIGSLGGPVGTALGALAGGVAGAVVSTLDAIDAPQVAVRLSRRSTRQRRAK